MAFNLATSPVHETVRYVSAYFDQVTGCSQALELQTMEPGVHERQTSLTLFHARSVPTIDLETYTSRILKYCPCQNEVFLALIVYMQQMIDRCARRQIPFTVDAYSIHRLIITGVTIGSKWFSDVFFTNSRYAKVGGLSVSELNNLEVQFLSIIDFDLNIRPSVLQAIGTDLFSGQLPKLTNVLVLDPNAYMATQLYQQQQPPASARYANHAQYYNPPDQQNHYYYPQPIQQPPAHMQHAQQQRYAGQPHRSIRRMSYPGPSGIYYSNPYIYPPVAKQAAYTEYAIDPASGSTLASSPPPDSMPISALHQGAV
ncbi:cyclin-like protein interacting with PHO85 [Coemansia sp. RSA 990]|nr:cyclin-like protein interacting with PHO85 [Coemansia sp. RSA 1086]KAJ1752224.1 cyclin-like protein interacting with PHO85 [Coemansia sp. RSA 1821]KAJ1873787.1 cyclin-like protein interacting with PHO85 [Coemansia sp. RSA 990]KAJ2649288.1 cyclin-like protein interacting with PHO85 [Coemansia sp. RSA 1250]